MKKIFDLLNISIDEEKLNKLEEFKKLLLYYNNMFNLTSITDETEIAIKHFADSIFGAKYFPENSCCLEIGSGGGFPSIPLKIYRDDLKFTLTDSVKKKTVYLSTVVDKLLLTGVDIFSYRAEEMARKPEYRENFDVVTARAVAKLNTLSEYCLPLVKIGGLFIAYKGEAEDEIAEAKTAIKILGGKIQDVISYELPEDMGKRSLVIIKKISETSEKYPRGQGKERSKPL